MNTKTRTEIDDNRGRDSNPDPITGAPGSHPLGTAVGSAGGAATGAAIGAIGGPVGMAVGGVIGAIVGGAAGHEVAENGGIIQGTRLRFAIARPTPSAPNGVQPAWMKY